MEDRNHGRSWRRGNLRVFECDSGVRMCAGLKNRYFRIHGKRRRRLNQESDMSDTSPNIPTLRKESGGFGQLLCSRICGQFKLPFSTFSRTLDLGTGENRLPLVRMGRTFPRCTINRIVSRISRDPVAGNHRQHFSDPTGLHAITI